YVCQNIIGGGWGGRPFEDGASAAVLMCQGDVKNTPIELQELYYPLLYERHTLRTDSGGAGEFRGGGWIEMQMKTIHKLFLMPKHESDSMPALGFAGRRTGCDQCNPDPSQQQGRHPSRQVQSSSGAARRDGDVFDRRRRRTWRSGGARCYGDKARRLIGLRIRKTR